MQVICLEDDAFYSLLDRAVAHLKATFAVKEDKWISPEEAMKKLRIKSKTTLQKLRDEGSIRFSHPERRIILYDSESIEDYLNGHSKNTF